MQADSHKCSLKCWTVADLKDLLRSNNLTVGGTKPVLFQRATDNDLIKGSGSSQIFGSKCPQLKANKHKKEQIATEITEEQKQIEELLGQPLDEYLEEIQDVYQPDEDEEDEYSLDSDSSDEHYSDDDQRVMFSSSKSENNSNVEDNAIVPNSVNNSNSIKPSNYTIPKLKDILREKGLKLSGNKADLFQRALDAGLLNADNATKSKTKSKKEIAKITKSDNTNNMKFVQELKAQLLSTVTDAHWRDVILAEFEQDYFTLLLQQLISNCLQYDSNNTHHYNFFPVVEQVFEAFKLTPFNSVKVVILGQDPYHDDNQAHGLSFSVQRGVKVPPSLKRMYKELNNEIDGFVIPNHGNLTTWATQGVLLLNATLTVTPHKPNSHSKWGWQTFTNAIIAAIAQKLDNVVFLLWGTFAQSKGKIISQYNTNNKHCIINTPHPSPLAKGFIGSKVFCKANEALIACGKPPIDWALPIE